MANNDIALDETSTLIASNKVEGAGVYSLSGEKLGRIYNFMVDKRLGQVEYAVLQFGGFLGIGNDYYPLPWEKLTYDAERGGYVIDIDRDTLEKAPHYTPDEEPLYNQDYGTQIHQYYGVNYP